MNPFTAPCGHPGKPVFGQFFLCQEGCDSLPTKKSAPAAQADADYCISLCSIVGIRLLQATLDEGSFHAWNSSGGASPKETLKLKDPRSAIPAVVGTVTHWHITKNGLAIISGLCHVGIQGTTVYGNVLQQFLNQL